MRIAVSATAPSLDADVDARFGRCACFVLADPATMAFQTIDNPGGMSAQGAGIATAQVIAGAGVTAVLTGNCGPNAYQALDAAGVKVITGVSGTVREAVRGFHEGRYQASAAPNVGSHFGTSVPGGAGRGIGGGTRAPRKDTPGEDSSAALVGLLRDLQGQLDSLRTQAQEINERIDDLHGKD